MTTYARIVGSTAVDVTATDPTTLFHADLAAQFIQVPDGTVNGATTTDGGKTFTAPVVVAPPAPPPPTYTPNIVSIGVFLSSMTSLERALLRAHTDPLVKEFVVMCTDTRITEIDLNLPGVRFDIRYAAGLENAPAGAPNAGALITNPPIGGEARADAILAGNPLAVGS